MTLFALGAGVDSEGTDATPRHKRGGQPAPAPEDRLKSALRRGFRVGWAAEDRRKQRLFFLPLDRAVRTLETETSR